MATRETQHVVPLFLAMREVFSQTIYILLAGGISFAFFAFAIWLPNLRLIAHTLTNGNVAMGTKLQLLVNLFESIGTNFTLFSAATTVIIAALFGINVAMIIYFIKKRQMNMGTSGFFASIGGVGSGIVGIGCAACGSLVLSSILPIIGVVGVLAILPLKGREFSLLSIGLLLTSIALIGRKIAEPIVCKPALFSKP